MEQALNRQIILASRPDGDATLGDFKIVSQAIPTPKEGQVLLRNTLISMDPYQRNLMGNGSSELPTIEVGTAMPGPTVAVIEQSNNPDFAIGDHVVSWSGWQEYVISDGDELRKIELDTVSPSTALGVLGHTGLSAWIGLNKFMSPKPGGTLVVTAAAGSVGSMAAQLAKLKGLRVVGIAGGPAKCAYLTDELGLDAAVDYKAPDFAEQLANALPDGIDALFDNVGDYMFEALMDHFNRGAQIFICGLIASYSNTDHPQRADHLPRLLSLFLYRFIEIKSFTLLEHLDEYPEFLAEMTPLVANGTIKYSEQFVEGFEEIPENFLKLFAGGNSGKLIAKVG